MHSQLSSPPAGPAHQPKPAGRGRPVLEPVIPDKLYFRIGEVAEICSIQTYVLRFWEKEFPQLRPGKSGTGQRLYRKRDVEMALKIRRLLYEEGFTIPGARQAFQMEARSRGRKPETGPVPESQPELRVRPQLELNGVASTSDPAPSPEAGRETSPAHVQRLRAELGEILGMLSTTAGRSRVSKKESKPRPAPQLFQD